MPQGEGNMQWLGSRASRTIIEGTIVFEEIADIRAVQRSLVDLELINVAFPVVLADSVDANLQL